jgi:hypothetical protein
MLPAERLEELVIAATVAEEEEALYFIANSD